MSAWIKLTPVGGNGNQNLINLESIAIIEKDDTGHAQAIITFTTGAFRYYHESLEEIESIMQQPCKLQIHSIPFNIG